jgi:hypothetical protein
MDKQPPIFWWKWNLDRNVSRSQLKGHTLPRNPFFSSSLGGSEAAAASDICSLEVVDAGPDLEDKEITFLDRMS